MKHKLSKRILSTLLAMVMLIGLLPTAAIPAFAGYEDGTECQYCGGYRFDDWLCDCGPHCSDNSEASDCYEQHHCPECGQAFPEDVICDVCHLCDNCKEDSENHCAICRQHDDDECTLCNICDECVEGLNLHCACGECLVESTSCESHEVDFGNDNNHCSGCAEERTCKNCNTCFYGEDKEFCSQCHLCEDCWETSDEHCSNCLKHPDEMCYECTFCEQCAQDYGIHCEGCTLCMEVIEECPSHPYEGGQDNHCHDCALICNDCGDCFYDQPEQFCDECHQCLVCCIINDYHCSNCIDCHMGEVCEHCNFCPECAIDEGYHCDTCGEHTDDWCADGGEGTHCVDCAEEFLCEDCERCSRCTELEFCPDCGLCTECCIYYAEGEGCTCGEYCVYSSDWEEHFCSDCGTCYDEVDMCELCGICLDCCESYSECSEGLCVEDPDYDSHFCEDCGACFHDSEACEDCVDAGDLLCLECCALRSEDYGCDHGICMNNWEWPEHYCTVCGTCFEYCGHTGTAHTHNYVSNICTICGARSNGRPNIVRNPVDISVPVNDASADDMAYRTVTFSVKAVGEGLTYQWYVRYGDSSTATTITADTHFFYDDIVEYSGYNTPYLTVWIPTECDVKLTFFCLVANANGKMTSKTATLTTEHCFSDKLSAVDKLSFSFRCLIDGEVQTIEGWTSNYHQSYCIGEGCSELSEEIKHNYGGWEPGALPTKDYEGYKTRTCLDCGFVYYMKLAKETDPHVHTWEEVGYNEYKHWGVCYCGYGSIDQAVLHTFGDEWETVKPATSSDTGLERRPCTEGCGYYQTRSIPRQAHTHVFYDWDYINENGYIDGDSTNVPYYGEYGKTDSKYHYAYCLFPGCEATKSYSHTYNGKWAVYPNAYTDGVWHMECGVCGYSKDRTYKAGVYSIHIKGGTVSAPMGRPNQLIKIYRLGEYAPGTYLNVQDDPTTAFSAYATFDQGKTWTQLPMSYHAPDAEDSREYWYFRMPKLEKNHTVSDWDFWVEVEGDVIKCAEEDHPNDPDYFDEKYLKLVGVVEATCGHPGYTGDWVYTCCNYVKEYGEVTPQLDHPAWKLQLNVGKKAGTCTERGYSGDTVCTACGEIVKKGEYTDYEHGGRIVTSPTIAPTCASVGWTIEFSCVSCEKVLLKKTKVAKIPHEWVPVTGTDSTCTEKGCLDHYECTMCGAVSLDGENELFNTARLTVRAGHDWGEWEAISETHHARVCQTDESHTGQARHDFVGGICADCGYKMPGVTFVSGTITSFGSETDNVILQLIAEGYSEADYEAIVKGNTATYSIGGVAPGTYTLRVVKNNHVTREYTVVVGNSSVLQDVKIHLRGDINGDGKVTTIDFGRANSHAKGVAILTGYELLCVDTVKQDGLVTTADAGRVNAHARGTSLLW